MVGLVLGGRVQVDRDKEKDAVVLLLYSHGGPTNWTIPTCRTTRPIFGLPTGNFTRPNEPWSKLRLSGPLGHGSMVPLGIILTAKDPDQVDDHPNTESKEPGEMIMTNGEARDRGL